MCISMLDNTLKLVFFFKAGQKMIKKQNKTMI